MRIILKGQVRGGKNNIKITRTGRRYPDPNFVRWSVDATHQVYKQLGPAHTREPINTFNWDWIFCYTPEDHRRRDVPAVLDAVFHVLEAAGVVADDRYISTLHFTTNPPDKEKAGMIIDFVKIL